MTVSRRKNKPVAKADDKSAAASGVQYHCDVCGLDISSTVRVSCASCENHPDAQDTYDLCCFCFLEGAESSSHKAYHDYRVVEQHAYPIFCDGWGADEELLLIEGAIIYGLGNWADIADHIGNRTKEETEDHYFKVFIEGRDGTMEGDAKAEDAVRAFLATRDPAEAKKQQLPIIGPNKHFRPSVDAEEFQKIKRQRIDNMRKEQAAFSVVSSQAKDSQGNTVKPVPPKPLVSAPTLQSEIHGYMPGRLEFESEYDNEAEHQIKDMEFGKVYQYGGEKILSEYDALGGRAEQGKSRMEASARGGPSIGSRGANKTDKSAKGKEGDKEESEGEGAEEDEEGDKEVEDDDNDEEEEEDGDVEEPSQMDISTFDGDDTQMGDSNEVGTATDAQSTNYAVTQNTQANANDIDDQAPDWDEDESDLSLKLCVLEVYNERLDRRTRKKEFVFDRNIVDHKRNMAAERKRSKEEKEILNRIKHFAQMQTASDFEDFFNGLCFEDSLRRAVAQLQMYRRAGITNLVDVPKFESEQAERSRKALVATEGGLAVFPLGGSLPRSVSARNARDTSMSISIDEVESLPGTSASTAATAAAAAANSSNRATGSSRLQGADVKKAQRKPPKPLELAQMPGLHLLTQAEKELCSTIRITPRDYMEMKRDIVVAFARREGNLSRRGARELRKMDVNKQGKVYDLLKSEGYLRAAARIRDGWDGSGAPPDLNEEKNTASSSSSLLNQAGPSHSSKTLPLSANFSESKAASASTTLAQSPISSSPINAGEVDDDDEEEE
ncbi:hypothetical protein CBS101457_001880 [Exobasidium rhododendri]|nr:hypothetical protein CBS101457_001880 [Exobasidium rhododendri]